MTPQQLQRFVVRMLWDPSLVERVYAGAKVRGLDAEGRAMLTRPDRRAWDTDPYRRARTLQALIEEYPCSVAEIGVAGLDAFFAAPAFHDAIQDRGVLALAFGAWMAPRVGPMAAIERAFAEIARAGEGSPPRVGELVRHPRVRPLDVPEGTLARWEALSAALGADALPTLLAGFRAPAAAPVRAREYLIAASTPAGNTLTLGSDGFHALLGKAARPVLRRDLRAAAVRLGATGPEADAILDELVADGLLVAGG